MTDEGDPARAAGVYAIRISWQDPDIDPVVPLANAVPREAGSVWIIEMAVADLLGVTVSDDEKQGLEGPIPTRAHVIAWRGEAAVTHRVSLPSGGGPSRSAAPGVAAAAWGPGASPSGPDRALLAWVTAVAGS
jgi:hypothetical protein